MNSFSDRREVIPAPVCHGGPSGARLNLQHRTQIPDAGECFSAIPVKTQLLHVADTMTLARGVPTQNKTSVNLATKHAKKQCKLPQKYRPSVAQGSCKMGFTNCHW